MTSAAHGIQMQRAPRTGYLHVAHNAEKRPALRHGNQRTVLKVQPVLGAFNSDAYTAKRIWATAADGT